jgi:hypothetical protein
LDKLSRQKPILPRYSLENHLEGSALATIIGGFFSNLIGNLGFSREAYPKFALKKKKG